MVHIWAQYSGLGIKAARYLRLFGAFRWDVLEGDILAYVYTVQFYGRIQVPLDFAVQPEIDHFTLAQQGLGLDAIQPDHIRHLEARVRDALQERGFVELQAVHPVRAVFGICEGGRCQRPSRQEQRVQAKAPDDTGHFLEVGKFHCRCVRCSAVGSDLQGLVLGQPGICAASVHSDGMFLKMTSLPT